MAIVELLKTEHRICDALELLTLILDDLKICQGVVQVE
jgi:hypothetical protein